jgi:hypothetical protein
VRLDDIPNPLFGVPVAPWHMWFAWRPVRTWDGQIIWMRWVWRRWIQKKLHLIGATTMWWQYATKDYKAV